MSEGNAHAEITESDVDLERTDEHRPLLRAENETSCSRSTGLTEITTNYSLVPDVSLPAQVSRPSAAVLIKSVSAYLQCKTTFDVIVPFSGLLFNVLHHIFQNKFNHIKVIVRSFLCLTSSHNISEIRSHSGSCPSCWICPTNRLVWWWNFYSNVITSISFSYFLADMLQHLNSVELSVEVYCRT